jgi:hypothetical protein
MSDVNISVYDNEDLRHDFQLLAGTSIDDAVATDVTGWSFAAEIRDEKDALVLRLDSDEDNTMLPITDSVNGKISFRIPRETLPLTAKLLKYDLLATDSQGFVRRLWGGKFLLKRGVTQTP